MIRPICKVVNNNQPGWTAVVETEPNVTLDVGSLLYSTADVAALTTERDELLQERNELLERLASLVGPSGGPYVVASRRDSHG
jgi:hypothetical protein